MRKTYMMLLALVLMTLGAVNASAVKADLDPAMFKAWNGYLPGAAVVENPEECPNSDGSTSPFGCDYKLYEEVGAGACVYGNTNVYYLWYADITGTQTITITGTPGMQFRILLNRPEQGEGTDPHGGQTTELNVTLDNDGVGTVDVSSMEYVHLNCIKTGWGSPVGTIRSIVLEGSVKPVTGWISLINNGDFEGDDLESFPVSKNGPDNGDTANDRPEIVAGAGPDGSRAAKVISDENAKETWSTQFYLKLDEFLPEGTQWRLSMDMKASSNATITSSAQGNPRKWHSGDLIESFNITTDWATYEFSGVVTSGQAGEEGMGSIAFDLNNDKTTPYEFFFDNISFEIYRESSPISLISTAYGYDVVRVDFGKATNMKDLVKAAGERVVYDNSCAKVLVNGNEATLMSVEGRNDGYLWIFIDEGYPEGDGEDVVTVSFNNPTDPAQQIVYTAGKYEGEPVPSFANIEAEYIFELSENYSYLYATPSIVKADPENGSFNLPLDLKEFKFTFDHDVDVDALQATLDREKLTCTPAEGHAKDIVLTRTGSGDLTAGTHTLTLANVKGEKEFGDTETYTLELGFGPVVVDPNDQPYDVIPVSYFNECASNGIPEGYIVTFGSETRNSESTYGSGSRMFTFGDGGDFNKGLYYREGNVEYGTVEGHTLALEAGKKYNLHFNTARWKASGEWTLFEIVNEADEAVYSEKIQNNPDTNGNTAAAITGSTSYDYSFVPEAAGNYRLRWTAINADGNGGFFENLLGNVSMKYVPSVLGVEDLALVSTALENAKATLNGNIGDRYEGAAFDALDACIKKYENVTFTAPSACRAAAEELDAAAQALKDHRTLIDTYDPLPEQAQQIVDNNAEKKFNRTEIYSTLVATLAKYGEKKTVQVTDPETGDVYDVEQVVIKELKDDAELKTAIDELQSIIAYAKGMFTEGKSELGDWQPNCTGYAVLFERIRLGIEALKSLGVPEDDELIVAANHVLIDDDSVAEAIKNRIKEILYGQLKDGNGLFAIDEETGEAPSYDMSVFIKNPNFYKLKASNSDYSQENVPGWVITDGKGLTTGWSQVGSDLIPADAMASNWGGSFMVHQTITDLPAGVYTVQVGFGERDTEESLTGSFAFAMNSAEVADSTGHTIPTTVIGQSFPYRNMNIEEVVVADGVLTVGVQAGSSSHVFFNDAGLILTAPATGFDYAAAYNYILEGIDETVATTKKTIAMEIYDMNGRQVARAGKGVNIVRRLMSDGTIQVQKVIVK